MLGPHVPDLGKLEMLVAVSEVGSLRRAGKLLGISQQAVSSRMRSLESQLGVSLVNRSAAGSILTETGRVIAEWAAGVLSAALRLDLAIESIRCQSSRTLDVAASLTIAEYLLPSWIVTLRDRQETGAHVATHVGMTALNSEKVIALVRDGTIPLGFVETPDVPKDVRSMSIGGDELRVAVAPHHQWAHRKTAVTASELAQTPLITREEGSGTRKTLERVLGRVGVMAPPRVEYSSTAGVRSAIAAGVAPGVLSSLAIADDIALGRLVAVDVTGITLKRKLTAVWSNGPYPVQVLAQDLVAIAQESLEH